MSVAEIPRVVVAQIGARRNYAVPVALEQAGLLQKFYTDWYAPKSFVTNLLANLMVLLPGQSFKRAASRKAEGIPSQKVEHFPWFALQYARKKAAARRKNRIARAYVWGGKKFCTLVARSGFPANAVVYCFSSAAKEILVAAKEQGCYCILDHEVPVLAVDYELYRQQLECYRDWSSSVPSQDGVQEYTERQIEEWHLADLILSPSLFCQEGIRRFAGPLEKVRILRFGIHSAFFDTPTQLSPEFPFKPLFAGSTPIRKGLPDYVIALEKLGNKCCRGLVAGGVSALSSYGLARTEKVAHILGNLPRSQMPSVYRTASVLVYPTVSDTFGAVVLEAMAAGLPVITTPHCGAGEIIDDGVDGFIVPVRDPEAIAAKLELLIKDRELLRWMGLNARKKAENFTIDKYCQRLTEILSSVRETFDLPGG